MTKIAESMCAIIFFPACPDYTASQAAVVCTVWSFISQNHCSVATHRRQKKQRYRYFQYYERKNENCLRMHSNRRFIQQKQPKRKKHTLYCIASSEYNMYIFIYSASCIRTSVRSMREATAGDCIRVEKKPPIQMNYSRLLQWCSARALPTTILLRLANPVLHVNKRCCIQNHLCIISQFLSPIYVSIIIQMSIIVLFVMFESDQNMISIAFDLFFSAVMHFHSFSGETIVMRLKFWRRRFPYDFHFIHTCRIGRMQIEC